MGAQGRSLWRVVGLVALAGDRGLLPRPAGPPAHRAAHRHPQPRPRAVGPAQGRPDRRRPSRCCVSCGPVFVPNHRPVPLLAYWADIRPQSIATRAAGRRSIATGCWCCRPTPRCRSCRSSTRTSRSPLDLRAPAATARGEPQPLVAAVRRARHAARRIGNGPCTRLRNRSPGVPAGLGLLPGFPVAHGRYRLRLLPSGPDLVHSRPPHGTWPSTPSAGVLTPKAQPLQGEFSLARADCECRAPLPPRLARSVAKPSAARAPATSSL